MLAIGGIGGLAIGLAGREICENLLNGFLIMSTVSIGLRMLFIFYVGSMQHGIISSLVLQRDHPYYSLLPPLSDSL